MKKQIVSQHAMEHIKQIISINVRIVDLFVANKWLVAKLSSGVKIKVPNE